MALNFTQASATTPAVPLSIGQIAQRIHLIRGQHVVLYADLAAFTARLPSGLISRSNTISTVFPKISCSR